MSLRFRSRHVHATLFDHIRAQLVALGWGDVGLSQDDPANVNVNFGTLSASYIDFQPEEAGVTVPVNTIAVTLGDEPGTNDFELGGQLRYIDFPVFVDVFGANQSIARSIASDVKDILSDAYLQVVDHSDGSVTDELVEIDKDAVLVIKPAASLAATDFRRHWQVVKATATVYCTP